MKSIQFYSILFNRVLILYAVFGQHLATFCYSRPVEVEAFDWSKGERYLRYRANGESAAWDLKRDEDSDFDGVVDRRFRGDQLVEIEPGTRIPGAAFERLGCGSFSGFWWKR